MCLGFVLSSVLVGGDTYRCLEIFEMVDALGFSFLRRLIFGKGGLILLERMGKVYFFSIRGMMI